MTATISADRLFAERGHDGGDGGEDRRGGGCVPRATAIVQAILVLHHVEADRNAE